MQEIHHQISSSSLLKVAIRHSIYEIWDDAQNEKGVSLQNVHSDI